ncbi:MAG TPA: S8 family serine peptidase [Polyangiaceae bacterium]|jgi:subtilisin family serine protease
MRCRPLLLSAALGALVVAPARDAHAQRPDGAALVRLLGPRAQDAFAPPGSAGIGALVTLPPGVRAGDVGLREVAPGIARLWGPPSTILAFADAHPGMPVEVAPPLHMLLDTAAGYVAATTANARGLDGSGVLVGVADTGLDVTHGDFIDLDGHTRVAWLLDLSSPPIGKHPELEQKFGQTDASGNLVAGAVWSSADIDALLGAHDTAQLPQDELGHGTLVTSIAAGDAENGRSAYRGIAPKATLLVARVFGKNSDSLGNDPLLQGTAFLFDRADAMGMPVVVNLSIGSDFGPHDGTMDWEQTLASYVGPQHPGHAMVVAAGNSGSIVDQQVHQNVFVGSGTPMHVPIVTGGATNGGVQVWVAMHAGANLSVGLDGPDGTWISPVSPADSAGKSASGYNAGVYNGSEPSGSPVPKQSHGAVVVWQGTWPAGTYDIVLTGSGTADLFLDGTGDALSSARGVGFRDAVREGTINLPGTSPSLIAVGCTINKKSWRSMHGVGLEMVVPLLDPVGGEPDPGGGTRAPIDGEPCSFSSAGPTLTGQQKPEIMAPGAVIIGALSQQAVPPSPSSIFTDPACPNKAGNGTDPDCQQVDALHGASFGTSFSSPIVAGAIAILFQNDPTLTQDAILAALQGGAHPLRGPAQFQDQASVGEVDVLGAVQAAAALKDPQLALPVRSLSWLTLGADQLLADGSTPLEAIVELRAAGPGNGARPPADGFGDGRLAAYVLVDGLPYAGAVQSLVRRGPGVWLATVQLPAGLGGSNLTVGATFDGADVVDPRSIPIATDAWNADYPPSVKGGCGVAGGSGSAGMTFGVALVLLLARRRAFTRA